MSNEIVDLNEVLDRVQHDHELLQELFDIFLDDCPKKIGGLKDALKQKDTEQIKDIAHSMKGASANIAAKKINTSFLAIEDLAKENNLNEIEKTVGQVETQLSELKTYIEELKEKFKSE